MKQSQGKTCLTVDHTVTVLQVEEEEHSSASATMSFVHEERLCL